MHLQDLNRWLPLTAPTDFSMTFRRDMASTPQEAQVNIQCCTPGGDQSTRQALWGPSELDRIIKDPPGPPVRLWQVGRARGGSVRILWIS